MEGSSNFKEYIADAAASQIQIRTHGNGEPLFILHGELGFPGWMNYHQSFSEKFTVYAPSHAGYDSTPPLDWIMHIRDMAGWYLEVLDGGMDCSRDGSNESSEIQQTGFGKRNWDKA